MRAPNVVNNFFDLMVCMNYRMVRKPNLGFSVNLNLILLLFDSFGQRENLYSIELMGIQIAYVLSDVKLALVVYIGMERHRMVLNKEALYGLKGSELVFQA